MAGPELIDQPNVPWCTRAQVLQWEWFASLRPPAVENALLDQLCWNASTWLWRATGRQFSGPGSTTVRPVGPIVTSPSSAFRFGMSGRDASNWFDSRGGFFGWPMNWGRNEYAFEILLGHTPVRSVEQVVQDGLILSPTAYRVDDARWLVRTDGQTWPYWQDWTHPSAFGAGGDQTSTLQVTLTWGEDPPPDGVYAASILAGEMALAATSSGECRLPRNVQSVIRQGTSMLMMDPSVLLANGLFGIPEIDQFVRSVNPHKLQQPATMTSPDIPRAVRRAGTLPGS